MTVSARRSASGARTPSPGEIDHELNGVSATSATDAWAVGNYGKTNQCYWAVNVILHWSGTAWSTVPSPDPGAACNSPDGVSALSPTDAWAAGWSCTFAVNTCHTVILHWNGTAWPQVPTPNPGTAGLDLLLSVNADSATDAWAAGYYCTISSCTVKHTLILHWNGTAWSVVATPNPGPRGSVLGGVTALSPTDAWAAGDYCTTTSSCAVTHTLILHWNGTRWSTVTSPNPGTTDALGAVAATAPGNAWAVGTYTAHHRQVAPR